MDAAVDVARRALGLIDLTDLGDHCTPDAIDELCRRAVGPHGPTAAVCIWPQFVAQAAEVLSSSTVAVATVVNFPAGGDDVDSVRRETDAAIAAGADEVDLVLPYRSFLSGRVDVPAAMVDAVRAAVPAGPTHKLKVILESGSYPSQDHVRRAAALAIGHGADFVKTSTGKTAVSATAEAVSTMLREIRSSGRRVGIKPSGGIRTLTDATTYLGLADEIMGPSWVSRHTFRFGASGLLDAVEAAIEGAPADVATTGY